MKKILIAIALVLTAQLSFAQKTPEQAANAVKAAKTASENVKKATKPTTWIKLAKAYMDAYDAPQGGLILNMGKNDLQLLMGNQKPKSVEQVTLEGAPCTKEVFADKDLYYNQNNVLFMIDVKKFPVENALENAFEAYKKAYEIDVKHSKNKDIAAGLQAIAGKYVTEGMNKYTLGDFAAASKKFGAAAAVSAEEPLNKIDTTMIYNAGFTAWMVKDLDAAQKYFERCLELGYYYEGGEVFAKLGDIYTQQGNKEASVKVLEDGFVKFPQSQSILIGLINFYLTDENSDTNRLFELLDVAKKNEPNNASLYYVEGNINKQLGKVAEAVAAYNKCAEINPEYEFGFIGAGILHYEEAIKLQEQAQTEFDDAKYNALIEQFDTALADAIEPFEKAYEISKDESIKVNVAEYLKNIYYRFITKGDEYKAKYDFYNEIVKSK